MIENIFQMAQYDNMNVKNLHDNTLKLIVVETPAPGK
jgi:hypothetical protein